MKQRPRPSVPGEGAVRRAGKSTRSDTTRSFWPAFLLLLIAVLPTAVEAQGQARSGSCTYDECALRLLQRDVLQGLEGRKIATQGIFRPPDLETTFARSDSALMHFRVVQDNYTSGKTLSMVSALSAAVGFFLYRENRNDPDPTLARWGMGIVLVSLPVGWIGTRRERRAEDALSRGIWWHNRALSTDRPGR